MSLPNIQETTTAFNETTQKQIDQIRKFPWAWTVVIQLGMIVGIWFVYDRRYSKDKEQDKRRIAELEAAAVVKDSTGQARLEQTRLFYDKKYQDLLDENKALYYRIGGIDAKKSTDNAK